MPSLPTPGVTTSWGDDLNAAIESLHLTGTHAARDALTDVVTGTLYSCTDHDLIYKWSGSAWATWVAPVTTSTVQTITGRKTFTPATASTVGLIVKGAASQSSNLQEWKNSADSTLAAVGPQGAVGIGLAPGAVAGGQASLLAVGGYSNLNGFRMNGADTVFPVLLDTDGAFRFASNSGSIYLAPAQVDSLVATGSPAAGETAISVSRNLGGTLTLQVVSMGAVDSAGTGFRALRVPN